MNEDHRQLIETIGASPLAMVMSNPRLPDNPIEIANAAFCKLTGYSEADIVGRNCRFLAGESTEPWVTGEIREALRDRRPLPGPHRASPPASPGIVSHG